tara:strand:- start:4548 stop:6683 length:2136 start_codon:yes stop_codon:yes gene_type:complete
MSIMIFPLSLLVTLTLTAPIQEPAADEPYFPASTALAEGVSPDALTDLHQLVQSFVDEDEIVGGELLVVKNGKTILHESYGLSDFDAQTPMAKDGVFCVRSMTKPIIGTAIMMLLDDKVIRLNDPIAKYLPAFDVDGKREITVEHLLTHTSGLPFSRIAAHDPRELESLDYVVGLGATGDLECEPGTEFHYSDQGADTLTVLIQTVAEMPAEQFVRARILDPLSMHDTTCLMTRNHVLRRRALPAYIGSNGTWTQFWGPDDEALFPIFLGSQGMYSTVEDYGRFLDFRMRRGRVAGERLLAGRNQRKALEAGPHDCKIPTAIAGLQCSYGYLMQLWFDAEPPEDQDAELVAFGHNGSDGTFAWAFPEQQAMVLFFTQSRGTTIGLRVEEALGELLLGVPFDANDLAPPFEEYMGYYWEGEGDLYRAIVRDGDDLALEVLAKGIVPLTYIGEDRWKMRPNPSVVLEFDRDENGLITGYHIGDHQEFRFTAPDDFPTVDEIAAKVVQTHRLDLLESVGPLRMTGESVIESQNMTGRTTAQFAWPNQFRYDSVFPTLSETVAYDGTTARSESSFEERTTLEGVRADSIRNAHMLAVQGDWKSWHSKLEVIQRITEDDRPIYLVRAGDATAPAPTMYVDWTSGHVLMLDSTPDVGAQGRVGMRTKYEDYRDVAGMSIPHRMVVQLANPVIGDIVSTVTKVETGVEIAARTFELKD